MRTRVSVLTRPDSRELPSNAELLHALGVDLHVVAQVSERLPRVAILAVVLPLDEPLLLAVVCAVLQHLLHLPLVVRRRHLRADLLERVGRDDKPPSAVLGAARTLPRLDELHVRHAHSPRCHEHLDVREGERRRSRLERLPQADAKRAVASAHRLKADGVLALVEVGRHGLGDVRAHDDFAHDPRDCLLGVVRLTQVGEVAVDEVATAWSSSRCR
mmetsp:Transcript_16975/g.42375  ORF Transcript_16975/g.42375 Transcript_16975/m.42375 type:complete len:216 (+) Transcript_16975:360-1007(+)